jgi:hypothetical protein
MPRLAKPALLFTLACGLAACANSASPNAASKPAASAPPATAPTTAPAMGPATTQASSPGSPAEMACVAVAMSVPAAPLEDAPPAVALPDRAADLKDAMGEIGSAFGRLSNIRDAQWQVPAEQPDIVPAAEAGRLTHSLRLAADVPEAQSLGEDYSRLLLSSIERASALEALIARSAPAAETEAAFKLLESSCNDCHATFLGF